jgi:molybdopterin-guanine dinucleotide biosynthesis protein A
MNAALYGLVLAGGRSTRMRADKAALDYHGRSQLAAAVQLLEPFVARAFVSVRADQVDDPVRAGFAQIIDREPDRGPIAGIMAAQAQHEDAAWLVLACDLPFLDAPTLAALVRARDPACDATAYLSAHDGLPEPLCAIYEPPSRAKLAAFVAQNGLCPRKFLAQAIAKFLAAPSARVLDNINTRAEYDATVKSLKPQGSAAIQLRVQYYALLREQAGRSEESVHTHARSARDLYLELARRYPFSLASEQLRVAVNEEFADWSRTLADGDCVVFIPPVAGG